MYDKKIDKEARIAALREIDEEMTEALIEAPSDITAQDSFNTLDWDLQ